MTDAAVPMAEQPSLVTEGLIVVSVIFPLLSLASVLLRFRARQVSKQKFGGDDWWIIASWVTTFALSVHVWVFAPMIGINEAKTTQFAITKSLQCLFLASAIVQIPLSAVKISILLFYRRIFNVGMFRKVVFGVIALVSCWGIIVFFCMLFLYDPVDAAWGASVGKPRFDPAMLGYGQVGSSIALDILVLCLPIPLIYRLHLDRKRKIAVMLIFWLGAFCVVAAIVRFILLHQTLDAVLSSAGNGAVHLQSKNFVFMLIEPNCSVIAACLPCYGPLLRNGRSQMSLVHSVRSLFSLRSQASSVNGEYGRYGSKGDGSLDARSATDSHIELKAHDGQSTAIVERYSQQSDAERGEVQSGGINVTSDVRVVRS
ncbi:hypothetical protein HBI25_136520 [Parastagonospora nodorum]|nr:hypothetical protein HBI72_133490 [Parastagonospora nodorum]KAH5556918.1 hypothetical protein HBI25_136520 [Parastagonospora nodorum]